MSKYRITKTYGHEEGLTTVFRQWRAPETHCSFLHGYSLGFELCFESETLDHRNWVLSFGELKQVKQWLKDNFDHTTLIAHDDPALSEFIYLDKMHLIQLFIVKDVGCEKFAEFAYENIVRLIGDKMSANNVSLVSVKVSEHGGNSATYYPDAPTSNIQPLADLIDKVCHMYGVHSKDD